MLSEAPEDSLLIHGDSQDHWIYSNFSFLSLMELRLRMIKSLAQGHTAKA